MATRRGRRRVRHEPLRVGITRPGVEVLGHGAREGLARDRREAERLIGKVDALREQVTQTFYRMGVALRALSRPQIYGALGYGSFADLLEDREVTSRFTAMKLISVVDHLEEEVALRLGVEKSYAFIR